MKKLLFLILCLAIKISYSTAKITQQQAKDIKCSLHKLNNLPSLLNSCKGCGQLPEGCSSPNCGKIGPDSSMCNQAKNMIKGCPSNWLDIVILQNYLSNLQSSAIVFFALQNKAQEQASNCWSAAQGQEIASQSPAANQFLQKASIETIQGYSGTQISNTGFCSFKDGNNYSTEWWVDNSQTNTYPTKTKSECLNQAPGSQCRPLDCTSGTKDDMAMYPTTCTCIMNGLTKAQNTYNMISYLWLKYLEIGLNGEVSKVFNEIFFDPNLGQIFPNSAHQGKWENIVNSSPTQSMELDLSSDNVPEALPVPVDFTTYYTYYTNPINKEKLKSLVKSGQKSSGSAANTQCQNWETNKVNGKYQIAVNSSSSFGSSFKQFISVPYSCPTSMGLSASSPSNKLPSLTQLLSTNIQDKINQEVNSCINKISQYGQEYPGLSSLQNSVKGLKNTNEILTKVYKDENIGLQVAGGLMMFHGIGCAIPGVKAACGKFAEFTEKAVNRFKTVIASGISKIQAIAADSGKAMPEGVMAAFRTAARTIGEFADTIAAAAASVGDWVATTIASMFAASAAAGAGEAADIEASMAIVDIVAG